MKFPEQRSALEGKMNGGAIFHFAVARPSHCHLIHLFFLPLSLLINHSVHLSFLPSSQQWQESTPTLYFCHPCCSYWGDISLHAQGRDTRWTTLSPWSLTVLLVTGKSPAWTHIRKQRWVKLINTQSHEVPIHLLVMSPSPMISVKWEMTVVSQGRRLTATND